MQPQCCRCNRNGRCRGWVCVRSNRPCTNCLPRRHGRCENLGDDSPNGITDGVQLEPPEPPEIHQSELPPAEYDSEHTESEQRNGTVRCVREGTNGGDGIDVGDRSMPNNCLSHVEFANDQILQSVNMQSAEYNREHTENLGDDSPNGITDGAQLEPPEIHQSELPVRQ